MMKKRFLASLTALMMFLAFAASAQTPAADPALATVNGEDILKGQVEQLIPEFLNRSFITDSSDYNTVLTYLVQQKVIEKKITDMGFDKFDSQEEEAFLKEAQSQWDQALKNYADYYQSEDTPEAKEAALKQAQEHYAAQGASVEMLVDNARSRAAMDRMTEYLLAGYTPSEEEVQAAFQQIGQNYQNMFEKDISNYEYMTQYAGQTSWYTPEGYRGVLHILLSVDAELMKQYSTLAVALEEQQQEAVSQPVDEEADKPGQSEAGGQEGEKAELVTQQMVDAAKEAVLETKKEEINLIMERLSRGEAFQDLIREYGEDPGMNDETNLKDGYAVHSESVIYDPAFTKVAFSDKMKQVGDVSDPALSSFGIHILYYLRDLPSGLIMTEEIHHELEDYLTSMKASQAITDALSDWMPKEEVTFHQDAIAKAVEEASNKAKPNEEDPVEALVAPETEATAAPNP